MSRLARYCTTCDHREIRHEKREHIYTGCVCCKSEQPTVNACTFEPEPFHQPGTVYNVGTGHRQALCSCDRCHERAEAIR